jgi:anti-sigma regulatory factor (Ser/Thr protein kinase)
MGRVGCVVWGAPAHPRHDHGDAVTTPKKRARSVVRRRAPARRRVARLRRRSAREAVAPMVERILDTLRAAGLTEEQRDNLAVAVAEALSNAAVHGNRLHPRTPVRVMVAVTANDCAVVEVSDLGPGFDANALADPTDPARVLQASGRGVFLMRRLVDRVEYNRAGNRVRLTMNAPGGLRRASRRRSA